MTFCPQFTVTPGIVRQIVAIERTTGFLNAVRLEPDWMAKLGADLKIRFTLAECRGF